MRGGRGGVGNVAELASIGSVQQKGGEHHGNENGAEDGDSRLLKGLHCEFPTKVRPARSASALAASITRATTRVTLTMRGRSRLRAACQASWPRPGESQSASM